MVKVIASVKSDGLPCILLQFPTWTSIVSLQDADQLSIDLKREVSKALAMEEKKGEPWYVTSMS